MKLIWKFNLVLLGIFVLGFVIAGYVSYTALQKNARQEILQNARLMMEAALSARNYTTSQVQPLLATQMKYVFLPQSVPAYVILHDSTLAEVARRRPRSLHELAAIPGIGAKKLERYGAPLLALID